MNQAEKTVYYKSSKMTCVARTIDVISIFKNQLDIIFGFEDVIDSFHHGKLSTFIDLVEKHSFIIVTDNDLGRESFSLFISNDKYIDIDESYQMGRSVLHFDEIKKDYAVMEGNKIGLIADSGLFASYIQDECMKCEGED